MANKKKTCTGCTKSLDLAEFGKRTASKDGLNARCKVCHSAATTAYMASPKGKVVVSNYNKTPERRAGKAKWSAKKYATPKGKADQAKANAKCRAKRKAPNK